jgi:multicomponent Na+:H+ antiporter subunit F
MYFLVSAAILLAMFLAIVRLASGPILYDRVLAANAFGTATVLLIAVLGFLSGRPDFLDIALLYALVNFVGTIAILKFSRYGQLGDIPPPADKGAGRDEAHT